MELLLGIDLGTSAVKAVIFDKNGNVVSSGSAPFTLDQPQNGWAEQSPEEWWDGVKTSIKAAVSTIAENDKIVGIGLSGQMHGLVMLDKNNEVLRPAIIWCDQRTQKECDELTASLTYDKLIEITANPALTGFTASKILWVKNNQPGIFSQCRHILLPKDYIRFKLTGEFATEVSDASGMQLLDVPKRRWSQTVIDAVGITDEMLPKVYESPEVTGRVTYDAAMQTGLSSGIPVVGGAGDNAAAAVGMGVVSTGKAFTTIGTSGVVFAHTDSPVIDRGGRVHTFCCAVPGAWHVMGVTQGAGLSLQWFKKNFCEKEIDESGKSGIDVYDLMTRLASSVPIGSEGLLYLPYLMGERTPHLDADCRGVFFGASAMHTKAHFIRSVMEGVTFSLKDCVSVLYEMDVMPEQMLVCGGGGKSPFWRKMISDVFSLPVLTSASSESPALGVAALAAVGTGVYGSVAEACKNMVKINSDICLPDDKNSALYERYYELYTSLYPVLKDRFKSLAKLRD